MVALASAFVRIRPQPDDREFKASAQKLGAEAGATAGAAAGKTYAEGFYRDAAGKLRQANGRFATDAQKAMIEGGRGAGAGFGNAFTNEGGGVIRRGFAGLKNQLGPLLIPAGAGAAVLAIGKIGIEYENNLNVFKAVTKATGEQMDIVADKARELGSDVNLPGVSAAGAAKAMTELSKAGFSVQQSMDAARGTLQLARIASIGEGEAAEIAANAVNAFGLKASEVDKVVDQLAATANSSSVEIKEVSYSFKQAAAVFAGVQGPAIGAKESVTELNTAIAILGNNGIKGSDAGTSLKQMLLQLTGPSAQAKDIMKELALNAGGANISLEAQNKILHGSKKVREETLANLLESNPALRNMGDIAYDANGKMRGLREIIGLVAKGTAGMTQEEKNYAVTQIFGADASRAVLALLKGGLPVYDKQRKAVLESGSAAKVAAAQNAGLGGAIDSLKGQFENMAIAIYNQVKGPLTASVKALAEAVSPLAGAIERLGTFVRNNGDAIKDWAVSIGVVLLAMKALTFSIAVQAAGGLLAYIKGIKIVTTTTRLWAGAQALLNVALLANPVGVAIAAIVALGAALYLAYRRSETFRNIVQTVWAAIKKAISATVDWFVNTAWPSLKRAYDQAAAAALWLWRNAILPAWNGIKAAIQFATAVVTRVISDVQAVFRALGSVANWLYQNIFRPVFAAITKVVQIWRLAMEIVFAVFVKLIQAAVMPVLRSAQSLFTYVFRVITLAIQRFWADAQRVFGLFRTYVLGPLQGALNVVRAFFARIFSAIGSTVSSWWQSSVRPVFNAVRAGWDALSASFSSVYNGKIKPLFSAFISFITKNVVGSFRNAVDLIRAAWDKVRDAARVPVVFVVNKVINPFINGLNKVAGIVGVKTRVEPIKGFASGGQIPGRPSYSDDRMASVRGTRRSIAVASGEFITNTKSTLANLPLVKAINAKRGKVTRDDVDPYLDGARNGGHVRRGGIGDGIGDFFGKLGRSLKGAADVITNPKAALTKVANAALGQIPGGGMVVDFVKARSKQLISGAMDWLEKFGLGGGLGGGAIAGGWKGMQRLIAARFPGLKLISGFRPGARTLSGNRSYHASGRAVDYPAVRALAAWIKSTFGRKTKELITPWQDLNLHNGQPHTYTGAVWNQHNFAGGNAHVHWAAKMGGLISQLSGLPVKSFDSGGPWPTGTIGINSSGRTEYVDANRNGQRSGGDTLNFYEGAFAGAIVSDSRQAEDLFVSAYKSAKRKRRI